jgi:hypothetical protein
MANALNKVNSGGIKDDSIVNADIKTDAAIALSKLASTPAVLTGSTNNTITTVTAANAIQGEANLTFDGTTLTTSTDVSITGASGNTRLNFKRTDAAGSNGNQFGLLKFHDNNDNQVAGIEAVRASAVDDADIVFKTRPTGGSVTERVRVDSGGKVLPGADNTQDLGSSSKRWANVYSGDLQLSNEGSANEVDGTWGNFTIQEGEDDLFLINRRNGKKYKFNLTEVN